METRLGAAVGFGISFCSCGRFRGGIGGNCLAITADEDGGIGGITGIFGAGAGIGGAGGIAGFGATGGTNGIGGKNGLGDVGGIGGTAGDCATVPGGITDFASPMDVLRPRGIEGGVG